MTRTPTHRRCGPESAALALVDKETVRSAIRVGGMTIADLARAIRIQPASLRAQLSRVYLRPGRRTVEIAQMILDGASVGTARDAVDEADAAHVVDATA